MGRSIAAAATVFAGAVAAIQHADLLGNSFGEPVVLVAMGTLFIVLSRVLTPTQGSDGSGLGATVLDLKGAGAA